MNSMANALRIKRLKEAIRDFHDTIDEIEVNRQLDGLTMHEILERPDIQYEFREHASIVKTDVCVSRRAWRG